jgi:hypothetical protein
MFARSPIPMTRVAMTLQPVRYDSSPLRRNKRDRIVRMTRTAEREIVAISSSASVSGANVRRLIERLRPNVDAVYEMFDADLQPLLEPAPTALGGGGIVEFRTAAEPGFAPPSASIARGASRLLEVWLAGAWKTVPTPVWSSANVAASHLSDASPNCAE